MEVGLDKLQASKPCKSHKPSVKINLKKKGKLQILQISSWALIIQIRVKHCHICID